MSKKNTRKRLLAGALSAVMMLTMCPTWALADDDGIATLPLVDESRPVVDFAPAADPIETPDVPSSSEPEVQEPAAETPSAGQDVEESGNNSNDPSSDTPEDNSQNNNADNNTSDTNDEPQDAANDVSPFKGGSNNGRPVVDPDTVQTINAEFWLTNRHAVGEDKKDSMTIDKDTVGDGIAVTSLAPAERTATADETHKTVFWQARVLSRNEQQTTASGCDRTSDGTEIEAIRYYDNKLQYCEKGKSTWTDFSRDDQLVFYYLIRTGYSQMVQIDVSDWTVTNEPTEYDDHRGVNYKVIVDGGTDDGTVLDDKTFWYNSALTVSSVRVRQTEAANYTINRVELDPDKLGKVNDANDEFQFSLDLSKTDRIATVNIYVSAKKYTLSYDENGGNITSSGYTQGEVYPDIEITVPSAEREGYTFDGWYDATGKKYETGDLMPGNDLKLIAKWTANTPTQPEQPTETKTDAMYFVLLPTRTAPTSGANQGEASYLPSSKSNGGVEGLSYETGYKGFITEAGKKAADDAHDNDDAKNGVFDANGVDSSYLVEPENLGFFDKKNWTDDGTYKDSSADTSILGDNFNPNAFEIVWYTIKSQRDGYHVDGYVKNIAINVTYHSNFGEDATYDHGTTTGTNYEALPYANTELPTRDGYAFDGWYTDAACTDAYTSGVLMSSLHLYAKWVKNVFDVTYFVDGTQDGSTESHKQGTSVTVRTDAPTKEGYTFTGWENIINIVNVVDGKFTMPGDNVRFDAQFTINSHKVIYKVDGNEVDSKDYTYGADVTIKAAPTKEGYKFSGWKIGNKDAADFNMPDNDVVIEGTFTAIDYTVTYYVDGDQYAQQTYHYGDNVQLLKNASKDGYTFSDWSSKDVTFNGTGTGFKMPAKDVVIEGTFTAVPAAKHRVSYYVDGVYYAPYATEWYETDATVTIKADLAKDDYTFSGWSSNDVTFNDNGTGFTMPDNDVEIHGSFSQNKYSYTINKHFYDEKGAEIAELASTATASGAENALIADLYKADAVNQTVDEKNYVYVPGLTKVTPALNTLTENITIDLHYYLDVKGDKNDPDNKGNDTPDAWEYRLTYKVVNGEWNNGGSADIVVYVPFKDKDGNELESVIVPATSIPAVGEKPAEGYVAGAWDKTPVGGDKVVSDTVFTYTYAKKSDSTDPTDPTQPTDPSTPDDSGNNGGSSSGGHSHHRNPTVTIPDEVPTGLNGDDHYAYIVGYPDKTVRPQNGITRAEVATIFFRLLEDETRDANSTKSNSYSDVESGAWYNHAVSTLSAMGIVKGDTKGKFNPNAPITRAEFAAIAARFDENANTSAATFSDIASHWAKDEISAAANNGWITGYTDGTFRPDNNITRAEAMTLVNRVLKRLPETDEDLHEDMITWSDNSDASQWYYIDVQEATNSHYYDVKENQYEKWTDLRDTRDWTELEK